MNSQLSTFWNLSADQIFVQVQSTPQGLITLIIPYTPLASVLGFQALPFSFVLILMAIVALYVTAAEIVKGIFYSRVKF
ncbi:MAG: hypothetical protein PX483_00400 [Nostocales cyanobacterium LE14-WE4]|jgi:hypothetical protein|nr:hypothetical protein [Anabaena sp. 49633_E8]MCE2700092.1 hypothetical protein [Anabaena sp. 49633_E8]MDJ0499328.1 hypothetical protein [Nostocales cyanobacterium LE14-WE4]OBQ01829.1 MAG: hypothetical protein AN482_21050 [Anabaena sp. LE011-02]